MASLVDKLAARLSTGSVGKGASGRRLSVVAHFVRDAALLGCQSPKEHDVKGLCRTGTIK